MPNKYLLSKRDQLLFEERAQNSFLAEEAKEGYIRLFNKNNWTTLHVKLIDFVSNRMEMIVEAEEVPAYFKHVLRPYDGS